MREGRVCLRLTLMLTRMGGIRTDKRPGRGAAGQVSPPPRRLRTLSTKDRKKHEKGLVVDQPFLFGLAPPRPHVTPMAGRAAISDVSSIAQVSADVKRINGWEVVLGRVRGEVTPRRGAGQRPGRPSEAGALRVRGRPRPAWSLRRAGGQQDQPPPWGRTWAGAGEWLGGRAARCTH